MRALTPFSVLLAAGCALTAALLFSGVFRASTVSTPDNAPSRSTAPAADADVLAVCAVQTGDTTWMFHVTVAHPDTGLNDYANGWDVVLPDGYQVWRFD